MYPVKGIYFSFLVNVVVALSIEEATENWRNQMKHIMEGYHITYNTTKQDENFINTIKEIRKPNPIEPNTLFRMPSNKSEYRKEYRCLTRNERNELHDAFNKMKNTKIGNYSLSIYDLMVRSHNADLAPQAHNSLSFLPWHRHFLKIVEMKLQEFCKTCTIPYWDTRLDRRAVLVVNDSVIFTEYLAGNGVGEVIQGFAANWSISGEECMKINKHLTRYADEDARHFFSDKLIERIMNSTSFNDLTFPWNDEFEMRHGLVHNACGGHMRSLLCSPNDPLFFFHHCMVDNIFEIWKKKSGHLNFDANRPFKVKDDKNEIRIKDALNHRMAPFDVTNLYGLTHDYQVTYERSPGDAHCQNDGDCCSNGNTEFIFCDVSTSKCTSKLAEGALLRPNFPVRACYCPFHKSPFIKSGRCACE